MNLIHKKKIEIFFTYGGFSGGGGGVLNRVKTMNLKVNVIWRVDVLLVQ